jgi:LPS-assembly protein
MTSALVSGYAHDAVAQAPTSLQADPVLLGMPPDPPEPPPAAKPRLPDGEREGSTEVLRVEPDIVEIGPVVPVAPDAGREDTPERGTAPPAQPEFAPSAPEPDVNVAAPLAGEVEASIEAPAASVVSQATDETVPPPVEAPTQAKAIPPPVAPIHPPSPAPQATALAVFRVDPALLGPLPVRLAERSQSAASPSLAGALPDAPLAKAGEREIGPSRDGGKVPHQESPLILHAATETKPLTEDDPESRPVFLSALRMTGETDREFVAEGEAELRKVGSIINADLMTYWPLEDEVEAEGRVRLQQGEDVMTGPKMRLRMEDRIGYFEQPFYQIKHQSLLGRKRDGDQEASDQQVEALAKSSTWNSGFSTPQAMNLSFGQTRFDDKLELSTTTESRGEAERVDFEGENHYRLLNNTFTTCPIDNDAWYVKTSELKLDYDREIAEGRNATVYFQDVPFLYSPWFSF